jgi:hypothetical protein
LNGAPPHITEKGGGIDAHSYRDSRPGRHPEADEIDSEIPDIKLHQQRRTLYKIDKAGGAPSREAVCGSAQDGDENLARRATDEGDQSEQKRPSRRKDDK